MPVLSLQEISSKDVNLGMTGSLSEAYHCLDFSTLEQALDSLDLFVSHRVDLSSELEVSLLLHNLSHPYESVPSLLALGRVSGGRWAELCCHFLFESDAFPLGERESLVELTERNHDFDGLVVLVILKEEMDGLLHNLGVIALLDPSGNILNHISKVVLNCQVHCSLAVSSSAEELDGFIMLALSLEVLGRLNHVLLARLQTHGHYLLVEAIHLGEADGVVEALGFGEVEDGLSEVMILLIVTSEVETGAGIVGVKGDLQSTLGVAHHA